MELELAGNTVLITGASKGIGRACALRFAEEGCHLRLVARTAADLERVQADIASRFNVEVAIYPLDLSVRGAVDTLMAENADIDILVNNAGAIPSGFINDIDADEWRAAWDLKVFGYIDMCRAAYANMKDRGGGVIVNIIGAGGEKPTPGYVAGGAGNAALMALTRAMGATSSRDNIRMVGLNPGLIQTERLETLMRRAARNRFGDEGRWQEFLDPRYPPGQPAHIADMAAFLASPRSGFTTGTIVTVDGGSSAR
jgi:NAD(P)-dependent dehydrogenase (short-subunit alcohol dehydrogenase family)